MSGGRSFEQHKYEITMRAAERAHDRLTEQGNSFNESATRDAQGGIRILLAINGGSAVAILAFVGGLKGKGDLSIGQIHLITKSLSYFSHGSWSHSGGALAASPARCRRASGSVMSRRR
jgi:hypothetical protein